MDPKHLREYERVLNITCEKKEDSWACFVAQKGSYESNYKNVVNDPIKAHVILFQDGKVRTNAQNKLKGAFYISGKCTHFIFNDVSYLVCYDRYSEYPKPHLCNRNTLARFEYEEELHFKNECEDMAYENGYAKIFPNVYDIFCEKKEDSWICVIVRKGPFRITEPHFETIVNDPIKVDVIIFHDGELRINDQNKLYGNLRGSGACKHFVTNDTSYLLCEEPPDDGNEPYVIIKLCDRDTLEDLGG